MLFASKFDYITLQWYYSADRGWFFDQWSFYGRAFTRYIRTSNSHSTRYAVEPFGGPCYQYISGSYTDKRANFDIRTENFGCVLNTGLNRELDDAKISRIRSNVVHSIFVNDLVLWNLKAFYKRISWFG